VTSYPSKASAQPAIRFGLRFKFLLLISLLFILLISGLAVYLVQTGADNLRHNLEREARSFATLATGAIGDTFVLYQDSGTGRIDREVVRYASLDSVISNISVVDLSGKLLYTKNRARPPIVSPASAASFQPVYIKGPSGAVSEIIYPYFETSGAHRYSVIYDISSREIDAQVQKEAKGVAILATAALLLTIVATYFLINLFILRPIRQVSRQASIISSGNLEQQIAINSHDEIAQLSMAVNTMTDSLKASIAELRELDKMKTEFMMIASHNLRTPLTIINGYVESAEKMTNLEQLRKALERISISSKRLGVFAEDVLTISRFELTGDTDLHREVIDLTDFIHNIADEFGRITEQQDRHFITYLDNRSRKVYLSKPHIRSALWNILDNALKFTPEGGQISLKLTDNGQQTQVAVSDSGIGISEEELPKLFTKFHRGTSTMRYDYAGTGIGLYASKLIVLRHGGEITVSSQPGKGSLFTISLPLVVVDQAPPNPSANPPGGVA